VRLFFTRLRDPRKRQESPKKPETRERRLHKFVAMLERGEKIHP